MSIELEKIKYLLSTSGRIIAHQEEIKRLKGESFNIFSILGMESNENATHSAFLGELLNPKGSHLLGAIFLERFLKVIDFKLEFDISSASLKLEKHVGTRDDQLKIGGRIDIYLKDDLGNSISIENKIYAGDQYAQIERYVNHNREQNTVYYLTLNGNDASNDSSGELKVGVDYYSLSYESTIVKWLEKCLKEHLLHELKDENWIIEVAENLENSYEGFVLYHKSWIKNVTIKLEGQPKIPFNNVVLGILAPKNKVDREMLKQKLATLNLAENGYSKETAAWPYYEYVLNWKDEEKRAELFDDAKRNLIEQEMFERIFDLAKKCEFLLLT